MISPFLKLILFIIFLLSCQGNFVETIYFAATGSEPKLSKTAECAVLTACAMNPEYNVIILSYVNLPGLVEFLAPYCANRLNVRVAGPEEILRDTPLLAWYQKAAANDGKFLKADVSDALRTAIMYKHGGVYYDLDMISVAPVAGLPVNSLAQQLERGPDRRGIVPFLNGAGMKFEAKHPYIAAVMRDFDAAWQPARFGSVGPDLLWNTYRSMQHRYASSKGNASAMVGILLPYVLPKNVFYPVKFKAAAIRFFFSRRAPAVPWFTSETVAVHLWSQLSSRTRILPASRGGMLVANCTDIRFLRATRRQR